MSREKTKSHKRVKLHHTLFTYSSRVETENLYAV